MGGWSYRWSGCWLNCSWVEVDEGNGVDPWTCEADEGAWEATGDAGVGCLWVGAEREVAVVFFGAATGGLRAGRGCAAGLGVGVTGTSEVDGFGVDFGDSRSGVYPDLHHSSGIS